MKKCVLSATIAAIGFMALGLVTSPFRTWESLISGSQDIILVKCITTPDPLTPDKDGAIQELRDGFVDAEVQIITVLKGTTNAGKATLRSRYWPRQGEDYLVFGRWAFGLYHAYETYRVVPLGMYFDPNIYSSGKTLNEKVQMILSYRLDRLNRELEQQKEEKKRLEDGIKELQTAR